MIIHIYGLKIKFLIVLNFKTTLMTFKNLKLLKPVKIDQFILPNLKNNNNHRKISLQ